MGEKEDRRLASDALRKQLARDVEALAGIGIKVEVEGEREGRLYRLPASGYSPAKVDLGEEERSVLLGALRALRRDFPYSLPLRLGIANLIGTVSLDDDEAGPARAVVSTSQDEAVARRVATLERAIARRKLVRFDYYAISRDEVSRREVAPYALSLLEGIWYVTGLDTQREAVRQFRLSRMRGRITYATKRDSGDFEVPDSFDRSVAGSRAPWQLEAPRAEARILISPEDAESARAAYYRAFENGNKKGELRELRTSYSGERQLAGWVLSRGERTRVLSPHSLVERVQGVLRRIAAAHEAEGTEGGGK